MDQNQASSRREVIVRHPHTGKAITYYGEKVYSVTEKGIVIAVSESRLFYPWSAVLQFNYHAQDAVSRKIIQGW